MENQIIEINGLKMEVDHRSATAEAQDNAVNME